MRFAFAWREHRDRCLIGLEHRVMYHPLAQCIHQRLQLHTTGADPRAQRRAGNRVAGACKDAFLTVQRQMVTEFSDQYVGEESCRRDAFVDDVRGHRCLRQRLTFCARPLAADVPFDREHARRVIEFLADVFADAFQLATARAERRSRFVVQEHMRQVPRQGGTARLIRLAHALDRRGGLGKFVFDSDEVGVDRLVEQTVLFGRKLLVSS